MKSSKAMNEVFVQHCGAVRLHMNGTGTLDLVLHGFPDEAGGTDSSTLVPLTMTPTIRRSQTQLANFKAEGICLDVAVDALNEYFIITGLMIFTRPVESGYPQ